MPKTSSTAQVAAQSSIRHKGRGAVRRLAARAAMKPVGEGRSGTCRTLAVDDLDEAKAVEGGTDHPQGAELLDDHLQNLGPGGEVEPGRLSTEAGGHGDRTSGH